MRKTKLFILVYFFCVNFSLAHQIDRLDSIHFSVLSETNFEGLAGCHVLVNNIPIGITDSSGFFKAPVNLGDSVKFSHIGYKSTVLVIDFNIRELKKKYVFLEQDNIVLEGIDVYAMPSESDFKKKVLGIKLSQSDYKKYARDNINKWQIHGANIKMPGMNAFENYEYYLAGPQPVTIFSNQKGQGLIPALKNVFNPNTNENKRKVKFNTYGDSDFDLWNYGKDTSK